MQFRKRSMMSLVIFSALALLAACSGVPAAGSEPGPDGGSGSVTSNEITAWPGRIEAFGSNAVYDDYVDLMPEGAGDLGIVGETPEMEQKITNLRDGIGDQELVHIWGQLECGVDDFTGCRVVVSDLHYGDQPTDPHAVQGWQGQVVCAMQDGGCQPALELSGDYPVQFGLSSSDAGLQERLANLQGSPEQVRIWGELVAGVPGVYGTSIQISRLEVDTASLSTP